MRIIFGTLIDFVTYNPNFRQIERTRPIKEIPIGFYQVSIVYTLQITVVDESFFQINLPEEVEKEEKLVPLIRKF